MIIDAFSGFSVDDLAKAKKFYTEVLGLKIEEQKGMGMYILLPESNAKIFVYPKGKRHQPAHYTVLNLLVDDIDKTVDNLSQKGVVFEQYHMKDIPQDKKGISRSSVSHMGPDIAWFKDPAGNIFSLLQEN